MPYSSLPSQTNYFSNPIGILSLELVLSCLHPFLLTFKLSDFLDIQGTPSIESPECLFSVISTKLPYAKYPDVVLNLGSGPEWGWAVFLLLSFQHQPSKSVSNGALSEVSLPSLPLNSVVFVPPLQIWQVQLLLDVFSYTMYLPFPNPVVYLLLPFGKAVGSCRVLKPVAPRSRSHRLFIHHAGGLPVDIPTLEV